MIGSETDDNRECAARRCLLGEEMTVELQRARYDRETRFVSRGLSVIIQLVQETTATHVSSFSADDCREHQKVRR